MPTLLTLRSLSVEDGRRSERLAHSRTEPARVVERAQQSRTTRRMSDRLANPVELDAVMAGVLAALTCSVLLALLGVALDSSFNLLNEPIGRSREAAVYAVIAILLSMAMGGWIAAIASSTRNSAACLANAATAGTVTLIVVLLLLAATLGESANFRDIGIELGVIDVPGPEQ